MRIMLAPMLLQRRNRLERQVLTGELPILPQGRPALGCPLDHETRRSRREAAGDDGKILDTNQDFTTGVDRVETG
jgi:hypothetical protein